MADRPPKSGGLVPPSVEFSGLEVVSAIVLFPSLVGGLYWYLAGSGHELAAAAACGVGFLLGVAWMSVRAWGKSHPLGMDHGKAFAAVSDSLGLYCAIHARAGSNDETIYASMRGVRDGVTLDAEIVSPGMGLLRAYTRGRAAEEGFTTFGLSVRKTFGERVKTVMGEADLVVGDAAFDAEFEVRVLEAGAEQAALGLLSPEVRAALLRLADQVSELHLDGDGVRWRHHQVLADPEHIARVVRASQGVIETIRTRGGAGAWVEEGVGRRTGEGG